MNKLFILLILALAAAGISQPPRPAKKNTPARSGTKSAGTSQKPADKPSVPEPTPVPQTESETFDTAVAAATNSEKARLLKDFIEKFPDSEQRSDAVSYLVTSRALVASEKLSANEIDAAISNFKLAVEDTPAPAPDRLFTDIIAKIPSTLFYQGQRTAAFELAALIEKKFASDPRHLLSMAGFYLGIENAAEAKRVAEAVIAADPTSAAAYSALGLAHRLNFDLEEAAKAYAKAIELDPASAAAKRSLADMKRAVGRSDEAAVLYREIVAANEKDALAQNGLILSLFDAGKRSEAESALATSLQAVPRNFTLLAGAGYWYAARGIGDKAVEYGQKAIDAEPRYIWGHIALARGYMSLNRAADAERVLIKARQYGNFPTLEYEIAAARYKAGLYREAVEELQKSFVLRDGLVETRLGGRVVRAEKTFDELLGFERRSSILEPAGVDDKETAHGLRVLFELNARLAAGSSSDAEIGALAEDFTAGDDKMRIHRQLHAADLLLQKGVAVQKAAELVKGALGNTDAGLDIPSAGSAVMASELYESRTLAFARNEMIVVPEVPRQTLSSILRGRIEELAGWSLYQQKDYPAAVVRLRRAVSVAPDKSAWWRSSMWRLATALEADGKDKEALETYIQTYKTDRPSVPRYGAIEALYQKVNGSKDGLEEKIGANPLVSVVTPAQPTPSQPSAGTESAENKPNVPAEKPPVPVAAGDPPEQKADQQAQPAKTVQSDVEKPLPPPADAPATTESVPAATEKTSEKEPPRTSDPTTRTDVSAVSTTVPATPSPTPSADTEQPKQPETDAKILAEVQKAAVDGVQKAVVQPETIAKPAPENDSERPPLNSPNTPEQKPATDPQHISTERQASPSSEKPAVENTERSADIEQIKDAKIVPEKTATVSSTASEIKTEPQRIAAPDHPKADTSAKPAPADTQPDRTRSRSADEKKADDDPAPQPVNLMRDPFAEPPTSGKPTNTKKPLIVVDDPLKPAGETSTTKSKDLFEPVIIKVPSSDPAAKQGQSVASRSPETKPASTGSENSASGGATRYRVVEGKEIRSDQQCSITVSEDNISILNGGGSLGVLVGIEGDGQPSEIASSTTSPRDIEIRVEREVEGISGRRFYVIRSISTRTGIYQVNFESPCGKKEITVRVR